ncbi:hypothetical protein HYW82_04460 [Candidatus Peregrinibacteria bacterium]|nr:hypothetical protein [Candidatus Peregrinibacteria bacterium]
MKTKLTLTIDSRLLPKIKHIAILQGTSLSNLVEEGMKEIINEKQESFAGKWKGKFKTASGHDKRYKYLAKKYS